MTARRTPNLVTCHALAAGLLVTAGCASFQHAPPSGLMPDAIVTEPFVQTLGSTEASVVWETSRRMYGWLELVEPAGATSVWRAGARGVVQTVLLTNLAPGARYAYRAAGCVKEGWRTLHTLDPSRAHYTLVACGDNRTHPREFSALASAAASYAPEIVINTGDIVAKGSQRGDWPAHWFGPGAPLLASAAVLVAWGNHEEPAAPESWLHYYYPARSPLHGRAYFAYQHGPVLYVHLNNYEPLGFDSPQYGWLDALLTTSAAPFIVVVQHVSPISSSDHARGGDVRRYRSTLLPLLGRTRASMLLTGHDHVYERSAYGGTHYVISGGGGAPLRALGKFANPFAVAGTSAYHFIVMDVTPARIHATVRDVHHAVLDEFTIAPRAHPGAQAPAYAAFDPPVRDYFEREYAGWDVHVRNFSTNTIAAQIDVRGGAGWLIEPGTNVSVVLARDEPLRSVAFRAWPGSAPPGAYPLDVAVMLPGVTNRMRATLEVLDFNHVRGQWGFSAGRRQLDWANAPDATIAGGVWRAVTGTNDLPVLRADARDLDRAGARDVTTFRMRLSGTNAVTQASITWRIVDEHGRTNEPGMSLAVPVNGQWYTHLFFGGRERAWRGRLQAVELVPASNADVTIELDHITLHHAPAPARTSYDDSH